MSNYDLYMGFLSSSELNRCKKNNLDIHFPKTFPEWYKVLDEKWLTRKLRRKLGHLISLEILPFRKIDISVDTTGFYEAVQKAAKNL